MAPTQKPTATATKPPTEDVTATATPTGDAQLDTAEPTATAGSEGSEGAEPTPTTTDETSGEGQAKSGLSGTAVWLVGGAAALGVLGLALIIGGIFFFGPRGRSSADGTEEEDEAP
jgi:uncharacterized membrane protein